MAGTEKSKVAALAGTKMPTDRAGLDEEICELEEKEDRGTLSDADTLRKDFLYNVHSAVETVPLPFLAQLSRDEMRELADFCSKIPVRDFGEFLAEPGALILNQNVAVALKDGICARIDQLTLPRREGGTDDEVDVETIRRTAEALFERP